MSVNCTSCLPEVRCHDQLDHNHARICYSDYVASKPVVAENPGSRVISIDASKVRMKTQEIFRLTSLKVLN